MTHPGKWRQNNEDSFLAVTYDAREVRFLGKLGQASMEQGDFVFAVSDGMGGANAGEFASRTAVDKITRLMPRTYRMAAGGLAAGIGDVMVEVFSHVHSELNKLGAIYAECRGMGATLASGRTSPPDGCTLPMWGTAEFIISPAVERCASSPTTTATSAGSDGMAKSTNAKPAATPARVCSISHSAAGTPAWGQAWLRWGAAGDRFLLCSDGIVDGMWDDRIAEYLALPATDTPRARRFIDKAVDESGRDNCTALVVEIGDA